MNELLCHLIGDYFLQNDWMALTKYRSKWVAMLHGFFYSLPFWFITRSWTAILVIGLTHSIVDHWKMANWISQLKNWNWSTPDGFDADRPIWLTVWLTIITDNSLHLLINHGALKFL